MSPCIPHQGTIRPDGYGQIRRADGRFMMAHRHAFERTYGWLAPVLDHTCHNADLTCPGGRACQHRRCTNPEHLEPVTRAENTRRGQGGRRAHERALATTHCRQGHAYTPENTATRNGFRQCLTCARTIKDRKNAHEREKRARHAAIQVA